MSSEADDMTNRVLKGLAVSALLALSALPASAGGKVTVTGTTDPGTTSGSTAVTVTTVTSTGTQLGSAVVSVSPGTTTTTTIGGKSVTVAVSATGAVTVNGQPLVVNGLPNIGLLVSITYGG
ncbi:hypothetical protein CVM39_03260 [Pseudooceanicola antarcticus]|uniref:DUF5666 domain-containing protein n=2 Tax=Pseudooceanicola antarcticus TaxID=1247613 RepID=A0ABX4MSJ2_9RHOB|nr:hypothetical protein CVM39_03260 [Pseudooceanicola antarcticus]